MQGATFTHPQGDGWAATTESDIDPIALGASLDASFAAAGFTVGGHGTYTSAQYDVVVTIAQDSDGLTTAKYSVVKAG